MLEIILLLILFAFILAVGIFFLKKIPDDKTAGRIMYIVTVLGILVAIIISLISAISDYAKEQEEPTTTDSPYSDTSDTSEAPSDNTDAHTQLISDVESNNDFTSAENISTDTEINGSFDSEDDVDCYYFSAKEKISFTMSLSHDYNDSDNEFCTVEIYDLTNDPETPLIKDVSYERQAEITLSKLRVSAGDYYIKISPNYYNETTIKDYTFSIFSTKEDNSFESEPNNSIENAKASNHITLDTNITGNIQTEDDIDYYYFTATKPGKLYISFSHNKDDNDSEFWDVELLAENQNNVVTSFNVKGNEANKNSDTISISPEGEGNVYYLKICPYYNHSSSDYKICVNFSGYEEPSNKETGPFTYDKEPNNITDEATPIPLNKFIEGNIQSQDDIDYYKIVIKNDGKLNVQFTHDFIDSDSSSWRITLLSVDSTENPLSFEVADNQSDIKSDQVRVPAGTYYLKIESAYYYNNDIYNFKIRYKKA